MLHPKFIIEGNNLIIGKVVYHNQLVVSDSRDVKGGGWYEFDHEKNMFTFYGESIEFGEAYFEEIKKCIESKNVFQHSHHGLGENIYNKHKFAYRAKWDGLIILKQE